MAVGYRTDLGRRCNWRRVGEDGMRFFRRRQVPPPLDPQLPPQSEPQGLYLPYAMADYPRQILLWLANYSNLSEEARATIAELVLGYNAELVGWLWMTYGYAGVVEADALSKAVATEIFNSVDQEYKAREDSLFSFLEEDMRSDDGKL